MRITPLTEPIQASQSLLAAESVEETIVIVTGIGGLLDAFEEFTDTWDEELLEILFKFIESPFKTLLEAALAIQVELLTTTPTVHPNPAIEEIHRQALILVYILAGLVFMTAGILYIVGPILGITYSQVRLILPRVIIALIFSTVSLHLLQLTVDLTDAVVHAFKPEFLGQSLSQLLGLGAGVLLAYVIQSVLLVGLAAVMIIRMVYVMFAAAVSPLLALAWSLPKIRRYADTFIAGYFAALSIAPLNLLVLRFSLALMEGQGTSIFQTGSNWLLGIASLTLLLLIPYQVWGASQTIVGKTTKTASKTVNKTRNRKERNKFELSQDEQNRLQSYRSRKQAEKLRGGK